MKRTWLILAVVLGLFAVGGMLGAGDRAGCKDKDACPAAGAGDASGHSCCGGDKVVSTQAGCPAGAGKDKEKARVEAKCPVSGEKISKTASVDYKGGKLYFCCAGCIAKFNKDKAKYEVTANQQLVLTGQVKQKGCPLSGGKVDASAKLEIDGIPVAFCCHGCEGKVKQAAADKQREMVFLKGFDKAFALSKGK